MFGTGRLNTLKVINLYVLFAMPLLNQWLLYRPIMSYQIILHRYNLNIDDIFNSRMTPLKFFLPNLGGSILQNKGVNQYAYTNMIPALQSMTFHRQMIQLFMLSEYLSQQILNKSISSTRIFMNRSGKVSNETKPLKLPIGSSRKLLHDIGSKRYKAWLKSATTSDDVKSQLLRSSAFSGKVSNRRQAITTDSDPFSGHADFDDGEITGYASNNDNNEVNGYNMIANSDSHVPQWLYKNILLDTHKKPANKNSYENVYDDYEIHLPPSGQSHAIIQSSSQRKDIGLKDITDIALTTLAFLSFGMFILQVLMCITMNKEDASNIMMLPMEVTPASDTNDGTEEIRRRKRSTQAYRENLKKINEMSRLIVGSIKTIITSEKRPKSQVNYIFPCTVLIESPQVNLRIWTALWSLGISWIATRFSNDYALMLKGLAHMYKSCT